MIGKRLRRLRLERGLTQRELAEPSYTHAYVSSIEAGRRRPSREATEHFAKKLGVGVEELITGRPKELGTRLELRLAEARIALSAGRSEEAVASFRSLAKEARRYRLPRLEARAEEGLGLWLERQGKPEEALERYQRAEEILRGEPAAARVDAVAGKARAFHSLGDLRYQIHLLESLLGEISREGFSDPDALAHLHAGLVFAYMEAGLHHQAAASATELGALAPRLSDPARIATMHMNVARLYLAQGDAEQAQRSLARAEDAYRRLHLKTEIGYAHLARGYVMSREGDLPRARAELESALAIFTETSDAKDLTRTLNELARVERLQGHVGRARELLERSIALQSAADTPILAWAHRELGLVLIEAEPFSAEKHFRTAIELYELADQRVDIAVTYRALGDLLSARGEGEAGCEAYRTGILAVEPHL